MIAAADMSEPESLSELIGDIYDAALDPALWPTVLEKIAEFTNGATAGLLLKDAVSKAGDAYYQFGVDDHYLRLYREKYWQFDPLTPLLFFDVGQIVSRADYLPDDEFREGRFYKEWVAPQGFVDAANVVLDKSVTSCALLSVIRSTAQGMVDEEMRRRVALLAPHVRRAVLIGRVIDLKRTEAAALADSLDGLAAGMFLVDAEGGGSCMRMHAPMSCWAKDRFCVQLAGDC